MQIRFFLIILQLDLAELVLELRFSSFELLPQLDDRFMQLTNLFVCPGHRPLDAFPFLEARSFQFFAQSDDRLLELSQFRIVFHVVLSY